MAIMISDFWKLYTGRGLMVIPSQLIGLFLPIFLYELLGERAVWVFLYYLAGHLLYAFLLPLGAQALNKIGFRVAIVMSTVWNALFYVSLLVLSISKHESVATTYLLTASILFLLSFRLFFWVPYHVEFAKFTKKDSRGMSVSFLLALLTFAGVVGPLLGGYIIQNAGFAAVFVVIAVISVMAFIPFGLLPASSERFEWMYVETWRKLFDKKHRSLVLAMFAYGTEDMIGLVVWPIFIFLLLDGSYFAVGALSSFIVVTTILLQLSAGRYLDKIKQRNDMLKIGSALSALGWVVKIFVVTGFHIFVAGLYHNLAKIFTNTPFNTMYYDMAADSGHYIDELTVLREMALHLGKATALVFVIVLSLFVAIQWTFLVAAVAALMLNALYVGKGVVHDRTA